MDNQPASSPQATPFDAPIAQSVQTRPIQSVEHDGMDDHAKSALVAVLLVWFYPIGVIFMFVWMKKWPVWAKILILLPVLFGIFIFVVVFGAFGAIFSSAMNQDGFLGNTIQCTQQCESATDTEACMAECIELPQNMEMEYDTDSSSDNSFDSGTQTPSEISPQ